jgi:malic enzyme
VLAAVTHRGELLKDQRIVFVGAGAAGIGIARLLSSLMCSEGADEEEIRRSILMLDSRGLVFEGREDVAEDKRPFAIPEKALAGYGLGLPDTHDLESVIRQVAPTVLIGTSGVPGIFTEGAIRAMAALTAAPIVLPLSNPTSRSEATPSDVLRWSGGRALVATGSPFDPVLVDGVARSVGQANNVFIFPGVGLGAIVSHAQVVTDEMFLVAAHALAGLVTEQQLATGALYPRLGDLRTISRAIAVAVAKAARDDGVGRYLADVDIEAAVDAAMWTPTY